MLADQSQSWFPDPAFWLVSQHQILGGNFEADGSNDLACKESKLKAIRYLHYRPLIMSQQVFNPQLLPEKVAFLVWVTRSVVMDKEGCYLGVALVFPC